MKRTPALNKVLALLVTLAPIVIKALANRHRKRRTR